MYFFNSIILLYREININVKLMLITIVWVGLGWCCCDDCVCDDGYDDLYCGDYDYDGDPYDDDVHYSPYETSTNTST